MKKFLALVLALVMTMSLVTISAGAEDFTDNSDITYEEAVDVMTAIGVVGGYTDGSFNPEAGLTRGAAAKIICNMILGPTTADALVADAAPYSDVAVDNVFAGYIAYCAQEGIISGYADGTFRPAAPLTGYAFMKMLLGTLGYDATKEGYVGSNWSIAVAKQALALGLDDGLVVDFSGAKALTREEACLYALNTLTATMVKYENDSTIKVGDITIQNNSKAEKIMDATDDEHLFMEEYFTKLTVATDDVDAFDAPANTWTWKNEAVGTYTQAAEATFSKEVTYGDLYAALGSNIVKKLNTVMVYVDGNRWGNSTNPLSFDIADITKGSEVALTTGAGAPTGNGVETSVYVTELDDGTYDVDVVIINTFVGKVQKVTAETAKKDRFVTLSAAVGTDVKTIKNSLNMTNREFATEDFAKDDYVTYTVAHSDATGTYSIQSMALAEKADSGVVEAYKNTNADTNFTVNGTVYSYNKVNNTNGVVDLDSEVDIYVDEYGYVVMTELYDEGLALDNYLVLTDVAYNTTLNTTVIANAITLDGQELDNITLGKLGSTKIDETTDVSADDTIYTFSVGSDGKYNLKTVSAYYNSVGMTGAVDKNVDGTAYCLYAGKTTVGSAGGDTYTADNATVFVVNDISANGGVKVYTGIKNMTNVKTSDINQITVLSKAADATKAVAVYVEADDTAAGKATAQDLVYILDAKFSAKKSGDDTIYTYAALVNGVETTISAKNDDLKPLVDAKDLYYISSYDGEYVDAMVDAATFTGAPEDYTITNLTASTSADYANGVLALQGAGSTFVLDDECMIFSIDKLGAVTEIEAEDLTTDLTREYWVVEYTEDDVTTAVAIYVQLS